ncbi:MAG: hypothetical protein ABI759_09900 [Candidatus Solibacter sp.]
MNIDTVGKTVQVVSVVAGVVISVLSFNETAKKQAETRLHEIEVRRFEAAKPFLELRQKLYIEALKAAAVITTPEERTKVEVQTARRRFRELYVAELSMVEATEVEAKMVALANAVDPGLLDLNPAQKAALNLAHALRDSFVIDWGVDPKR